MTDEQHMTDDGDEQPKTNQIMRRGFDGGSLATENVATQALIAKSTADTQSRWIMALKRPRDMHTVRQSLMVECKRPAFAKAAVYAVPRGGTTIRGLSIRFAEVAMRCFGNMNAEAQTLYDSDEERVVRITVTEYESNTTWTRDITVKKTVERKKLGNGQRPLRERTNSFGDRIYIVEATDDDVVMKESSAISKASRTGILRLIPGHIQDEMKRLCEETVASAAAKDPDSERNALFDAFATLSITPAMLTEYLGHPLEQATPVELTELRYLYGGLRDGQTDWGQVAKNTAATREALKAKAKSHIDDQKAKTATPATTSAAPASSAPVAPDKVTPPKEKKTGGSGTSAVKDKIAEAKKTAEPVPATAAAAPAITPAAPPKLVAVEVPPDEPPPRDGYEDRNCAICGCVMEVPKTDPPGGRCYACSQA